MSERAFGHHPVAVSAIAVASIFLGFVAGVRDFWRYLRMRGK